MNGDRLKQLRTRKKLTQSELGKQINVTKVSISGYENGNRTPDTDTLERLADFFGVSTDYLLGRSNMAEIGMDTNLNKAYIPYSSSDHSLFQKMSRVYRNPMITISQRLKELRNEAQLTQADVAKYLNISESAYGYYEQGRNEISISKIKLLAEKYNVSVAYILGESNIKHPLTDSEKDEVEFQAFANNPTLQKWYMELPKSKEEDLERLRKMWEILKEHGEL